MTSYDPDARRDTPLAEELKAEIQRRGAIPVQEYVQHCLFHPEFGYYRRQLAIGGQGDFITAPEISQTFGELIGLWSVAVWQQMGAPPAFHLIEYGAGRGTLMCDALRAARVLPEFLNAAKVTLCDINAGLREIQREAIGHLQLPEGKVRYREAFDADVLHAVNQAAEPAIIIANEFLDVWPPDLVERADGGWQRRCVGLDGGNTLQFVKPQTIDGHDTPKPIADAELDRRFPKANMGDVVTVPHYGFIDDVTGPWSRVAALFIDYGHTEPEVGDTLQAVRNHTYEHPLTSPGEADLTHQVDFQAFAERLTDRSDHLAIDGTITQAEFLGRLGILQRASRLMSANPSKAGEIEAGVMRLMSPQGMGGRIKAIGVRSKDLPTLPGFE